jgi:hypothetical protein
MHAPIVLIEFFKEHQKTQGGAAFPLPLVLARGGGISRVSRDPAAFNGFGGD